MTTTHSPDPWSEAGYSIWKANPLQVRRNWMTILGCSEEEIAEHCADGQVADLDEELAEYNAAVALTER